MGFTGLDDDMTKFEPVFSYEEIVALGRRISGDDDELALIEKWGFDITPNGLQEFQQAVQAKLREQKPFLYLRTRHGEPYWNVGCISAHESDLIPSEEMRSKGYSVMPLYTSPMPTPVAQEPSDDTTQADVKVFLTAEHRDFEARITENGLYPTTPMGFVVSQTLSKPKPAKLNNNELKGKYGPQIIRMHREENMRFSEIAEQLNISRVNVGRIYNQITGEKSRF